MATESPVRLIGSSGASSWTTSKDSLVYNTSSCNLADEELGYLSNGKRIYGSWRDAVPNRSGSAPPSIEGSLDALNNLIGQRAANFEATSGSWNSAEEISNSEDWLRGDPAYLEYYSTKVNLNPRLPPPLISRESRRLMHRIGGIRDWGTASVNDNSKGYLFLARSSLSTHKEESEDDRSPRFTVASDNQGASSQCTPSLESHHPRSIVEFMQENVLRSPLYDNPSQPSGSNSTEEEAAFSSVSPLQNSAPNIGKSSELNTWSVTARSRSPKPGVKLLRTSSSTGSLSLSASPTSSCSDRAVMQPRLNGRHIIRQNSGNGPTNSDVVVTELENVNSELRNLKIRFKGKSNQNFETYEKQSASQLQGSSVLVQGDQHPIIPQGLHPPHVAIVDNFSQAQLKVTAVDAQPLLHSASISAPFYTPSTYGNPYYQNLPPSSFFTPQYGIGGFALNASLVQPVFSGYSPYSSIPLPIGNPVSQNFSGASSGFPSGANFNAATEFMQPYKFCEQLGVAVQPSIPDPYVHFLQQPSMNPYATVSQYNTMMPRTSVGATVADFFDPHRVPSSGTYSPDQRFQLPRSGAASSANARKGGTAPNYSGNTPYLGVHMPYPTTPHSGSVFQGSSIAGTYFTGRRNDTMRFQSTSRNFSTSSGAQGRGREKSDDRRSCSFLEELKSNRTRRFELSDIAGRIVEFSADQHGSRFIQQKLENCSAAEKASVFEEILPHASSLMTDVFGNYVIQKFFEHGSSEQRKELANKLIGSILPLSLQMYGCRVIQKALEVIELGQKTQLVQELHGHVMRCVRDQNGNHVIQKCIECVPTENIGFIISAFRGQVAALSMHPYGCRVIQRVLEHCTNDLQGQCIVDEISQSACSLAQDQYGNYVTQHVLERGKPYERSQIVSKLAGQVVLMSQNKFASNVIEKCFEHGDTAEKELLIKEIVEQTEGNDNLLLMMKDQFANYVVQKILETCNDKQREILLSRVRVHLPALRKYTYGKHIVARVEQLCGEGPSTEAAQS